MSDLLTTTDQMGREVTFSFPPKRIISLVPSQTEFLIDIGAPVVGRTKFCVHPKNKIHNIPVVGGTKKFRYDQIRELHPDLIIGNKEENYQEGIDTLSNEFPVWMSDIFTLEDSFSMMSTLGSLCDLSHSAQSVSDQCKSSMAEVKGEFQGKVIYLIWKDPWMAAGKNTFIDHVLGHLGYQNLVSESRYPELSLERIGELNPDKIFLSSEPYPFKAAHISQAQKTWPGIEIELVDGELYSWYGSRLRGWGRNTSH